MHFAVRVAELPQSHVLWIAVEGIPASGVAGDLNQHCAHEALDAGTGVIGNHLAGDSSPMADQLCFAWKQ